MPIVDASFLIGLLDPTDQWHSAARAAFRALKKRGPWRMHSIALAETLTAIGKRAGGKASRDAFDRILDSIEVAQPAEAALRQALAVHVRYDGNLSFSDSYSIHLSEVLEDRVVLSFDSDFDGKGLERLPA